MSAPFWKVRIDCWYADKPKNRRVIRRFIVQAENSTAAMLLAKEHAQATAAFGPKWIGFEDREAIMQTLPLDITCPAGVGEGDTK